MSAVLLAEVRQKSLRYTDQAEDVGVEHRHVLIFGGFLNRSGEAVSCVVDEDIYWAMQSGGLCYDGGDLGVVSHIQGQM